VCQRSLQAKASLYPFGDKYHSAAHVVSGYLVCERREIIPPCGLPLNTLLGGPSVYTDLKIRWWG
jgi:hypothetical protein